MKLGLGLRYIIWCETIKTSYKEKAYRHVYFVTFGLGLQNIRINAVTFSLQNPNPFMSQKEYEE